MTIPGNFYGVALNDRAERDLLAPQFDSAPYGAPPSAPVVYMKPRASIARCGTMLRAGESVKASPTLALLFSRDAVRCGPANAMACVGAIALALDVTQPQANYYRPAIGQSIRDGFLVLGDWMPASPVTEIATDIDGQPGHSWQLDRLVREPAQLIADLSAFMTLRAGDALLIGLPGDAPSVRAGQSITVRSAGLPPLHAAFEEARS